MYQGCVQEGWTWWTCSRKPMLQSSTQGLQTKMWISLQIRNKMEQVSPKLMLYDNMPRIKLPFLVYFIFKQSNRRLNGPTTVKPETHADAIVGQPGWQLLRQLGKIWGYYEDERERSSVQVSIHKQLIDLICKQLSTIAWIHGRSPTSLDTGGHLPIEGWKTGM